MVISQKGLNNDSDIAIWKQWKKVVYVLRSRTIAPLKRFKKAFSKEELSDCAFVPLIQL